MSFYPQNGSLYRSKSGRIYRVHMTVTDCDTGHGITLFHERGHEDRSPVALSTREFGDRFSYIPNWIDYADNEEIPLPSSPF